MEKNAMLRQREENYKKWFDRWIKSYNLKKQITAANNQNYTCLNIPIHNIENNRDKMMMADDKFIEMLGNELPDFKIRREKEVKDIYFLGNKICKKEFNIVFIDWS